MSFETKELDEEFRSHLISTGGWNESCPVSMDRLNLVEIAHLDFEHKLKTGKLLVMDVVAENVVSIFKELLTAEFPINSMNLLEAYGYDDYKSMSANNSSCFNNRLILPAKDQASIHAYGLAIDVNPAQNPMATYVSSEEDFARFEVYPEAGKEFMNRSILRAGMVEPIVDIFLKNGFDVWGGSWKDLLDYHHFQTKRELAEKLAKLSRKDAKELWQDHLRKVG